MKRAILLAEDDETARAVLIEAYSQVEGWVITAVEDGAKALAILDTMRPNLIVLDVDMPGIDGIEVYRRLRDREGMAEVPVLFVSGEPRSRAKDLDGSYAWLAKSLSRN